MKLLSRAKKELAIGLAITSAICLPVGTMAQDYKNHWAQNVIEEWQEYGVLSGYEDGTFKPDNQITRAELATVLCKLFNLQETDGSISFQDVSSNIWYAESVNKVVAAGIMQGAGGKFSPNAAITRQEVAVALVNAYQLKTKGDNKESFTDAANIADWAKDAVEILSSHGYISGRPNSRFDPKACVTRAEVIKILDNMVTTYINKLGTYESSITGNVMIACKGVTLKNMTISGNLYLAQGVKLSDINIENVVIQGEIIEFPTKLDKDDDDDKHDNKHDNKDDKDDNKDDKDDDDDHKESVEITDFVINDNHGSDTGDTTDTGITVEGNQITVDLNKLEENDKETQISEFVIVAKNLEAGIEIETTIELAGIALTQTKTVSESGELVYEVEEIFKDLNRQYEQVEASLEVMGALDESEKFAEKLNYDSLETFLAESETLSAENLNSGLDKIMELYSQNDQEAVEFVNTLSEAGIDLVHSQLDLNITLEGESLKDTALQVHINF